MCWARHLGLMAWHTKWGEGAVGEMCRFAARAGLSGSNVDIRRMHVNTKRKLTGAPSTVRARWRDVR